MSSFPKFESLKKNQIYLAEFNEEFSNNPDSKRDYCFYVVNHTARLETVNLDWGKFEDFKKKAKGIYSLNLINNFRARISKDYRICYEPWKCYFDNQSP